MGSGKKKCWKEKRRYLKWGGHEGWKMFQRDFFQIFSSKGCPAEKMFKFGRRKMKILRKKNGGRGERVLNFYQTTSNCGCVGVSGEKGSEWHGR